MEFSVSIGRLDIQRPAGGCLDVPRLGQNPGLEKEALVEIVEWDRPNRYSYRMDQRAFPMKNMASAIALHPRDNGTEVAFDAEFGLVGPLRFVEGPFGKMGETLDGRNLETAKRLLEADETA